MDNLLIVRGVDDFDDMKRFGLGMANKVAKADIVIGVNSSGRARALKSPEQMDISFIDSDSKTSEIVLIIWEIKNAYQSAHPDDARLAHAFVGMWLFYWIGGFGDDIMPLPIEMIAAGDVEKLRESAHQFINSDFGNRAGRMDADGGSNTQTA